MARILANPFGELRGKAGGSVFSRNRAGQFMRVYVKPAQANSVQQLTARGQFGANSQAYSTLGTTQKGSWANFATNIYNPLRKTNLGQYTAQQAYIGITTSVQSSANKIVTGTWCTLGTTTPITHTSIDFVTSYNAPNTSVQPTVQASSGLGVLPLSCTNLVSTAYNKLKFNLNFGATGVGILAGQLVDGGGKEFTIGMYYSDPLKFAGSRPKNKWQNFVGNFDIPSFTTPLTSGTLGLTLNMTDFDFSGWKRIPQSGDIFLVTFLAIGIDGTQATINSDYVTIP